MKEGRKVGAASADATPPLNVAAGGAAAGPPPGLGAPGAAAAAVPAPLGSRAGSGTSSASGAPEVRVCPDPSRTPALTGSSLSMPMWVCCANRVCAACVAFTGSSLSVA